MSTVKEIEAAILALPPMEREKLVEDLPAILPELNGDAEWARIINDPRPRPALTALGDEIAAQLKTNPERFPEIRDSDFNERKEIKSPPQPDRQLPSCRNPSCPPPVIEPSC